jgi:transposase
MDLVEADTGRRKAHTFRGVEEKRRIVEETLKAGVSVSSVARAHGINANQVFQWRKLYRDGLLDVSASANGMRWLPVAVPDETGQELAARSGHWAALYSETPSSAGLCSGTIELTFDWGGLRIVGAVDRETLRTVLGCLLT